MPIARPFTGLLYDSDIAGPLDRLTGPPYDSISQHDRDRYHALSPFNVVRLDLGRDEPGDGEGRDRYTRAGSLLRRWRRAGVLAPTRAPAVFPYELRFLHSGEQRRIRGVIAEIELEPWGGSILPHERTLPGPIEDRLRLIRAARANLSPVYLTIPEASSTLAHAIAPAFEGPAERSVTDESGTEHRLWISTETSAAVASALADVNVMIADGHHRYTVALAYREEMRAAIGSGPWDSLMAFLVPVSERPPVLPYHRVVTPLRSLAIPVGQRVRDLTELLRLLDHDNMTVGVIANGPDGVVHTLATLPGDPPTVCALHERVLSAVGAPELKFTPDAAEAEELVREGRASTAFLLPPTRVEDIWRAVGSRGRMPEKSTLFWPKPRTGLVIRPFD